MESYRTYKKSDTIARVLDKLMAGTNRKDIEYEENISQSSITQIKANHPLFFWRKENE